MIKARPNRGKPTARCLVVAALGASLVTSGAAATSCLVAATRAEAAHGLPVGLLGAMTQVESGGHPWTINAAGTPRRHAGLAAAVTDAAAYQARGVLPLDIGCFQVSLGHHPGAFASLEEAFNPVANADYAARFLRRLRLEGGSWDVAVARYHSRDEGRGSAYRARVAAAGAAPVLVASKAVAPLLVAATAARPLFTAAAAREAALRILAARLAAVARPRLRPAAPGSIPRPPAFIERF